MCLFMCCMCVGFCVCKWIFHKHTWNGLMTVNFKPGVESILTFPAHMPVCPTARTPHGSVHCTIIVVSEQITNPIVWWVATESNHRDQLAMLFAPRLNIIQSHSNKYEIVNIRKFAKCVIYTQKSYASPERGSGQFPRIQLPHTIS